MAKRKPRSDSAAAAINAMLAAASPLPEVPAHVKLRADDKPFWEAILRARAREEWTEADLVLAAQLARLQSDIERQQEALDVEGAVLENRRGTQIMNPRHSVLQQLAMRQLSLMRSLRMVGVVATGDKRDLVKARDLQRQAERALTEVDGENMDDLLAT